MINISLIKITLSLSFKTEQKIDGQTLLADQFVTGQLKSLIPELKDRYTFTLALNQLKYVS